MNSEPIVRSKAMVPYRTTWELLAQGLYFQSFMRLAAQAKRYIRRRKIREYPWIDHNKVD